MTVPEGYLGAEARITSGPAAELVAAGYALELADAPLLHDGLGLADLAHVIALHEAGVLPAAQRTDLLAALLAVREIPVAEFPYDVRYGDAYNSRERELERRLGAVAGWLHTGRTRREAGRIAFRLALRDGLLDLHASVTRLLAAAAMQARAHAETVWADTTYLQPAQPSTFGHYLGGFGEECARHLDRVEQAYRWADRSPGGVGGVGGSRVPLDRARLAELLGFAEPGRHTRDVMWSTDGLADAVLAATQAATTADRLAEDLEVFASPAFGYVELDASLCRASVLMPQKRNPYALAVIRSGAGTLIGRTTGMLATQRTPSARTDNWLHAYGESSAALGLATRLLNLTAAVLETLVVKRDVLAAEAGERFTGAADLAEELVLREGLDYRTAYRVVGRAVALAVDGGQSTLTETELAVAARQLIGRSLRVDAATVAAALDPSVIVDGRTVLGGSAPERVREHAAGLTARLSMADGWRADMARHNSNTCTALVARATALGAADD